VFLAFAPIFTASQSYTVERWRKLDSGEHRAGSEDRETGDLRAVAGAPPGQSPAEAYQSGEEQWEKEQAGDVAELAGDARWQGTSTLQHVVVDSR